MIEIDGIGKDRNRWDPIVTWDRFFVRILSILTRYTCNGSNMIALNYDHVDSRAVVQQCWSDSADPIFTQELDSAIAFRG